MEASLLGIVLDSSVLIAAERRNLKPDQVIENIARRGRSSDHDLRAHRRAGRARHLSREHVRVARSEGTLPDFQRIPGLRIVQV